MKQQPTFQTRPPLPRYTSTWNVGQVLDYLWEVPIDQSTSLKHLSLRTVMSLALTRPSRSVDLSKLDLWGYRVTLEGSVFLPLVLAKQSRPGREIKEFFFPRFSENTKLCPIHSLTMYIDRTKVLRGDNTQLFISFTKPHNPVTSSPIAQYRYQHVQGTLHKRCQHIGSSHAGCHYRGYPRCCRLEYGI